MEEPTVTFTKGQIKQARKVLDKATTALGPLTFGQGTDLLLDNLEWLEGCQQAKMLLVESMEA